MDFRLKVFKKVVDHLSFSKAARELHVSQPAVSKHISKLEDHFEKALILREGNRIRLTAEGQLLLSYANRILDLYQQLENDFMALNHGLPDQITLGASTTISQYILPKALSHLKRIHPQLSLTLINGNTEKIERMVENHEVDLGFTEGRTSNPLLHYETFRKDEIVLATRTSNKGVKKEEFRINDLTNIPLVSREEGSGTRKVIESTLEQYGIKKEMLDIEITLGSTEGIKSYLLSTDSFAFISIHAILDELKSNQFKIIDVKKLEINRNLHFVHLHGQHSPFIKLIKRIFTGTHNQIE